MELHLSKRMQNTASMVKKGAKVADIGCDHGYLGIWLILNRISTFVIASDLRPMPLKSAEINAAKWGTWEQMKFVCASGLQGILPDEADTFVFGGMGGDLITEILSEASWIRDKRYTLLLQPQAGVPKLRTWLCQSGFSIEREYPCYEDHFAYSTMEAVYTGIPTELSPGSTYVSPAMLRSGKKDTAIYMEHMIKSVTVTLEGLRQSKNSANLIPYYQCVRDELEEMKKIFAQDFL